MRLLSLLTIALIACIGCNRWVVPAEYVGHWEGDKTKIEVRTEPKPMKFQFMHDSATVSIDIGADKKVSGRIGDATFAQAELEKNWGLPATYTGVAFIVNCGSVGRFFPADPLSQKEVELWIGPIRKPGEVEAELRYTERHAQFPMAGILFKKNKP